MLSKPPVACLLAWTVVPEVQEALRAARGPRGRPLVRQPRGRGDADVGRPWRPSASGGPGGRRGEPWPQARAGSWTGRTSVRTLSTVCARMKTVYLECRMHNMMASCTILSRNEFRCPNCVVVTVLFDVRTTDNASFPISTSPGDSASGEHCSEQGREHGAACDAGKSRGRDN